MQIAERYGRDAGSGTHGGFRNYLDFVPGPQAK